MPKLIHRLPKSSLHNLIDQAKVRHNDNTFDSVGFVTGESNCTHAGSPANQPKQGEDDSFTRPVKIVTLAGASLLVGEAVLRFFDRARGVTGAERCQPSNTSLVPLRSVMSWGDAYAPVDVEINQRLCELLCLRGIMQKARD